ncbi:hypothetical protein PCA31118_01786 [Pandoraea captiosa]|uniref:Phosphonate metabolism protein n=1 Tax=Pandoraea captiosa TaxID=2508302 RepID=A0A5E4ZVE0_9BURK|nr:DUF1045 domain-containing protein [Pandoraea captiosa]VVE64778.1 hypothetical protein PCA31118_01786 [Pandoraea captiosa]
MTGAANEAMPHALDLRVARFAIYYAPPAGSCWWNEGSRWLGRDALARRELSAPNVPGLSRSLSALTADPRRYGLHATLKAPMRLAPQRRLRDLTDIAEAVAARHTSFDLAVQADVIGADNGERAGFVALRPRTGSAGNIASDAANTAAINALAADCVEAFDVLRAPLDDADMAKRQPASLTSRQRERLAQWGYPYVFDEFRFHVTLSDRVDRADARVMIDWWQPRAQALGPMRVDSLAIFVQPTPDEPFHVFARFAFGKAA